MALADSRLEMRVRPVAAVDAVMDVAMLGHCSGNARWDLLLESPQTVAEIARLGFAAQMETLRNWLAQRDKPPAERGMTEPDPALLQLYELPIPLLSLAHFQVLFPQADRPGTNYRSQLAGNSAWLPAAVADFFQSSQAGVLADGAKKLWIFRIAEQRGQGGFLPDPHADYADARRLSAFDRAMLIPNLGAIALPDLERLQVPANLADVRRMRLVNPDPVFLPCAASTADDHRERRRGEEIPKPVRPWPLQDLLAPMLQTLKKRRPDVQCLLTLPLEQVGEGSLPTVAREAVQTIGAVAAGDNTGLHAVQFLFPYLTGRERPLCSPVGLIAGAMLETSQRLGPWRSMAGKTLPGMWQLYPPVHGRQVAELREQPGVGVLVAYKNRLQLDDERRAAPVVGSGGFTSRNRPVEAYRSGEVARFLGWLHRQLLRLGESWLFNTDVRDPLGKTQLTQFFTGLHRAGALRGALPEQAFSVAASHDNESTVIYRIELAPVFPIDRIVLNFSHDLGSNSSQWQLDIKNG
ncbi:hypothetical protein NP590_06360 [Methylomonas sp. SURF-2]|uniref:Tail sheath protein subtilisin-like domain-containing protein n=1 Tax=Methylomonas subterranea TaxID=2952225 RepID=A0ABT1TE33_9GAMM|nr:hypothetical protein [Methylomonas sp. SURF-2]MCQ8103721.1 hypothetical protein [Methylomonas sp. SURF-2]